MIRFRRKNVYSVQPDRDEWVAPEETLIDSSSALSTVEVPVGEHIFRWAFMASAALTLLLIGWTARLAIIKHGYFVRISDRNRTITVSVPPPRGIIMDRRGTPLVQNVASFDLLVISRQVRRNADGTFVDVGTLSRALARDPSELASELDESIQKNAIFFVEIDLTREQLLSFRGTPPAGFYLVTSTKREYVDGPQFSGVVGYVGKVSRQDIADDDYYTSSDTIGRLGAEASYEASLRGTHGKLAFSSSGGSSRVETDSGDNVVLHLDADVQRSLFLAVSGVLRASGLDRGAAIVQDPKTGAVLGMASFPTYDNNVFGGQLSNADRNTLFNDRDRPLFNRVISGLYNPGSTIKPFVGMAALQERVVSAEQVVSDGCVSIAIPNPRDTANPYVFKNWREDTGQFALSRAIANSCNTYFFTIGGGHEDIVGLGVERIVSYLTKGLANALLGIDLPGEETGFIPSPDWKYQTKKEQWYQGDTYNISIGQGDLLVTPLWINTYVSAIANGGTLWRPQITARIVDDLRNPLTVFQAQELGRLPFSPDVIEEIQHAMREAVVSGTARLFKDLSVKVAAKTGTAEIIKGQRVNSLVTAYAPADNPQIVLTVLIEGSASNQGYALQAAMRFLQSYFQKN